jgi:hypothetical protein
MADRTADCRTRVSMPVYIEDPKSNDTGIEVETAVAVKISLGRSKSRSRCAEWEIGNQSRDGNVWRR